MPNKSAIKTKAREAAKAAKAKAAAVAQAEAAVAQAEAADAEAVAQAEAAEAEEKILTKVIAITTEKEFAEWSYGELNHAISLLEKNIAKFEDSVTETQMLMFGYVMKQKRKEAKKAQAEAKKAQAEAQAEAQALAKALADLFARIDSDDDETPDSPVTTSPVASNVTTSHVASNVTTSPMASNETTSHVASRVKSSPWASNVTTSHVAAVAHDDGFTTITRAKKSSKYCPGTSTASCVTTSHVASHVNEVVPDDDVSALKQKATAITDRLYEVQFAHNSRKYGECYVKQIDERKATKQEELAIDFMLAAIKSKTNTFTIDVIDHDVNSKYNKVWIVKEPYFIHTLREYVNACIPGYWISYQCEGDQSDLRSVKIRVTV